MIEWSVCSDIDVCTLYSTYCSYGLTELPIWCDKFIKVEIVHTKHLILIVTSIITESQACSRLLNPG